MDNRKTGVVLLVEDTEDDVFLMERALLAAGVRLRLHIARDGREAINYLAGSGIYADRAKYPFPDVMFLDLKLPYRSGPDILRWLAKQGHLSKLFTVVLTSSDEPGDVKLAYELGAKTYLVKPPTPQMIQDIVHAFRLHAGWLTAIAGYCLTGRP